MVELQDILKGDGVFQGSLAEIGGYAFHKIGLFSVYTADDDVGIADINGEYHKQEVLSIKIQTEAGHGAIIAWIDGRRKNITKLFPD